MRRSGGRRSGMSLREAASVVFGLVAVLPILLFVYLLSRENLLQRTHVQIGLFLAVAVSVVGFLVFRRMLGHIARLVEGVQAPRRSGLAAEAGDARLATVPGLGQVREISQVTDAFYQMLKDLRESTQRLEDLVFKLGTLNETVELAARIPRIQDLLGQVLQTTMRAVRATVGSIMIVDKEGRTLRLVASRGIPDDVPPDAEVNLGEGIAGTVAALGEPALVDDIETDPRFSKPNLPRYGNGSFICMPIRAGDRVIGVINMAKGKEAGGARPQPFSPIDLQFLNALMTYIGYAADNARLLEEAQQSAEQLQSVVGDLKTTQEQLVRGETLRAMGQLSSGMAHHLNNLFAVILGRTGLLLRGVEGAATRRSLEIIQRAAQDGADVARRVQRFSRLQPAAEPVAVDLNRLAVEVVERMRPRWQDEAQLSGRHIEVAVEPGQVPPAVGELAPLREVLMNLLLNGVDAMPEGGQVTIRTWAESGRVHCAVTDTGVGMTEEVSRRALEPFFTTKGPERTGLGLSLAYAAVKRYGGTLRVDSAPGRGTTVRISLPVASLSPGAEMVPDAPPARATRLSILVIDDDVRVRETLADLLDAQGHAVVQASDGEKGIARLRAGESFDLVLTDLGMPGMTGWDVARAIQHSWPGLPVGLITGWGEEGTTGEERSGVDFVITKPFDPERLRETLAGVRPRA